MQRAISVAFVPVVLGLLSTAGYGDEESAELRRKVAALTARVATLETQLAQLRPVQQAQLRSPEVMDEIKQLGGTPGPIASSGQPVEPGTPLNPGDVLQVQWNTSWWVGKVVKAHADGNVDIHYLGWDTSWDETVPRARLQLDPDAKEKAARTVAVVVRPQAPVVHPQVGGPGPIASSGMALTDDVVLEVGQRVQAEWGGSWWAGRVIGMMPDGKVKIHYEGWDASWDEAVPRTWLQVQP